MTIGKVGSRPKPAPDHCAMNELQRSIRAVGLPDAGRTLLGMTTESWRNSIFISSGTNQLFANAICRNEGSNGKKKWCRAILKNFSNSYSRQNKFLEIVENKRSQVIPRVAVQLHCIHQTDGGACAEDG
jgi:hypothetical protein